MNLAPIARRVKIRISSGGSSHADLDSLLRRFSISDLLPLISDGRLNRWLIQIGEPAKADALDSIQNCRFSDPESIKNLLHIFFEFDSFTELVGKWEKDKLAENLNSLRHELLLFDDVHLALHFAENELTDNDNPDKKFWQRVLSRHKATDAETAARMIPLLSRVDLTSKAKELAREFASDEKIRRLRLEDGNEAIVKQLRYWLTNIRLFHECKPQIRLDNEDDSEFLNCSLFIISQANRNYYSKNADDHGVRYRPSMILGRDAILELIQSQHKQKFVKVLRLIAYLCKMQFFDKGGSVNTGSIPGLDLLSHKTISYSEMVKPKMREITTVQDFAQATFAMQIIFIVSETLVKNHLLYFGDEK